MLAAVSASISTPVCACVAASASMLTPVSEISARTSTCVSGKGWQSGINSLVRLPAMMPASRAVSNGSPFGVRCARTAATVAFDINTRAEATARRAVCAFALVSTIATRPRASMCVSFFMLVSLAKSSNAGQLQSLFRQTDDAHNRASINCLHTCGDDDERGGLGEGDEIRRAAPTQRLGDEPALIVRAQPRRQVTRALQCAFHRTAEHGLFCHKRRILCALHGPQGRAREQIECDG